MGRGIFPLRANSSTTHTAATGKQITMGSQRPLMVGVFKQYTSYTAAEPSMQISCSTFTNNQVKLSVRRLSQRI